MSKKTADVGHRVARSYPHGRASVRMHRIARCAAAALALTACAGVAQAGPVSGSATTYQGRLVDDGTPIDGTADISVSVWDADSGGNQIGSTLSFPGTPVTDGLFSLELDFGAEAFDGDRWLEITVDGSTLSPRQKVTAAPYAVQTRGMFVDNAGQVAVGHNVPESLLHLQGGSLLIEAGNNANQQGILFRNAGGDYIGQWVRRSQLNGGAGTVRPDIRFRFGQDADPSGLEDYLIFRNNGDGLQRVGIGDHVPSAHLDVRNNGTFQPALRVENLGTEAGPGNAIWARNSMVSSVVARIESRANTGFNDGVFADVDSPNGVALRGLVNSGASGTGAGVEGSTDNGNGIGVRGVLNNNTGAGYAVYGDSNGSLSAYGVFSNGNLGSSGLKTFRIDHPADPANLYLQHYSAEAPEPTNVYSGNAVLGADGSVWVELPGYFGSVNTDERYVLTAIGAPAPNLHVAQEVVNNSFLIAGGSPGMKVSWQVTARRDDPYARAAGVQDIVVKQGREIGRYLQPALYGQPASKALFPAQPAGAESATETAADR